MEIKNGFVFIEGSDEYWSAYQEADKLEKLFPEQCAYDFIMACEYNNELDFLKEKEIITFELIRQGENDGSNWCWLVTFKHESYNNFIDIDSFIYIGGCDYTGWDCQSHLDKYEL